MTNIFACDMCGKTVGFEENAALIRKGEKMKDLCPECEPLVVSFIEEKKSMNDIVVPPLIHEEPKTLSDALEMAKKAGFIFYRRDRKKKQ